MGEVLIEDICGTTAEETIWGISASAEGQA